MILGRGFLQEVSSRHNGRHLCLSFTIRLHIYKRNLSHLSLQLRGCLFLTWSLDHSISSVPMVESLPLYFNQLVSPQLPCKQPESPPLLCNQADSPLLCAQFFSLASPYGNQPLPHQFCEKCLIYLPRGRIYVQSKQLYA